MKFCESSFTAESRYRRTSSLGVGIGGNFNISNNKKITKNKINKQFNNALADVNNLLKVALTWTNRPVLDVYPQKKQNCHWLTCVNPQKVAPELQPNYLALLRPHSPHFTCILAFGSTHHLHT